MVGKGSLQFLQRVVACQNGARADIAVTSSFDVVLHVPHKKGLVGAQMVVGQYRMNRLPLIQNPCIRLVEVVVDPKTLGLMKKILMRDRA